MRSVIETEVLKVDPEHRTLNIDHRTSNLVGQQNVFDSRRSMFDVLPRVYRFRIDLAAPRFVIFAPTLTLPREGGGDETRIGLSFDTDTDEPRGGGQG